MINFRIASVTSSAGDSIAIAPAGVTCFVGGNNVGKSQLLREVAESVGAEHRNGVVLREIQAHKDAVTLESALEYLETNAVPVPRPPGQDRHFQPPGGGQQVNAQEFVNRYNSFDQYFSTVRGFFVWYASAGSLVGLASGAVGADMEGHAHPLQVLLQSGDAEVEISALSLEAFGIPLTLERLSANIKLRVGAVEVPVPPLNRPTRDYARAVTELPELLHQGDGIKSYIGLMLYVLGSTRQVMIVDEPEAFLHPAQARSLGRWLAHAALERNVQLVIATHDRDLCLGLLDGGAEHLSFVRISRDAAGNHLRSLPATDLVELWSDPVLRYSNLLQGLFHRSVVICEADADCRFFSATLDALAVERDARAISDDVLFVPSGGKQRVATMARALKQFGVDVRAIIDFDALRTRRDVRSILEAVGGAWSAEIDADYKVIADHVNSGAITWDALKNLGLAGLGRGEPYEAGQRLLDSLRQCGAYVLPVGEMEDLDKSIGLKGAAWVSSMLEKGGHTTNGPAREIAECVLMLGT